MSTNTPNPVNQALLGTLLSVQAGRIQRLGTAGAQDPLHRPWRSAFIKSPISGAAQVGHLGVEGDEQADRKHHGGPDQALLMYSADHFPYWRGEMGLEGVGGGGFGENLTVSGFTERDVCIGDRLRVGSVLLEVTQPRKPCSNINRRWGRDGVTQAVTENGRGGWYLRVIEPGSLAAGEAVTLEARPHPELAVSLANEAMYGRTSDPAVLEAFLACPQMPEAFKRGLRARLEKLSA